MSDEDSCVCGTPNRANFHVHVILGRDIPGGTETSYTDIYACAKHLRGGVRPLLRFDGHEGWKILHRKTTYLRGPRA